jgi:hypothetical protein
VLDGPVREQRMMRAVLNANWDASDPTGQPIRCDQQNRASAPKPAALPQAPGKSCNSCDRTFSAFPRNASGDLYSHCCS